MNDTNIAYLRMVAHLDAQDAITLMFRPKHPPLRQRIHRDVGTAFTEALTRDKDRDRVAHRHERFAYLVRQLRKDNR